VFEALKPEKPKLEALKPENQKPEHHKPEPEKVFDQIDEEIEEFRIAEDIEEFRIAEDIEESRITKEFRHHDCKCHKCHEDKFHCHWEFIKCKECQHECHRCDRLGDKHCDHNRCNKCKHDRCRICKRIDHHDRDKGGRVQGGGQGRGP